MGVKKFQLDKTELLINTDWGTPVSKMDEKTAKEKGFIKWQGRWVSEEEKKQLKQEDYAYKRVRAVAIFCFFFAIVNIVQTVIAIFNANFYGYIRTVVRSQVVDYGYGIAWSILLFYFGINLLRYKNYARYGILTILFIDLIITIVALWINPAESPWAIARFFILVVAYFYLYNKRTKIIFS